MGRNSRRTSTSSLPAAPQAKRGMTRRKALWVLAAAAVGAAGWGLFGHFKSRVPTRETRTVKSTIENHPSVKEKEIFWYKSGPGKLREAGMDGARKETYSEHPRPGDRSSLHTHPIKLSVDPFVNRVNNYLYSNPSPQDARAALEQARTSSVRTAHVAVVNEHGKVIGYWSWRYKKSLLADAEKCEAMIRRFDAFNKKIFELNKTNPNGKIPVQNIDGLVKVFTDFIAYLEQCRKDGLIIHRTAAAGYHYKDGFFQPK